MELNCSRVKCRLRKRPPAAYVMQIRNSNFPSLYWLDFFGGFFVKVLFFLKTLNCCIVSIRLV